MSDPTPNPKAHSVDRTATVYQSFEGKRTVSAIDEEDGHNEKLVDSLRNGRFQTQALLNYQRNRKSTITLNNLRLIVILNFFPLIAIGYCLAEPTWYLIGKDNYYEYYVNPIYVAIIASKQIQEYKTYLMLSFQSNNCNHNLRLCQAITNFVLAGLISTLLLIIGMALHFFSIMQLTMMIRARCKSMVKCMSPLNVQLVVLFTYIMAMVYWFFASGLFTEIREFTKFIGNTGKIVIVYFVAIVCNILLMLYLKYMLSVGRKNALVNKLLSAEQELLREINEDRPSESSLPL